jgi:hypothetical protein
MIALIQTFHAASPVFAVRMPQCASVVLDGGKRLGGKRFEPLSFRGRGELLVIGAITRVGMLAGCAIRKCGCSFQVKGITAWLSFVSNAPRVPRVRIIVVVLQIIVIHYSRLICDAISKDSVYCSQRTVRLPWLPGALGSREPVGLSSRSC